VLAFATSAARADGPDGSKAEWFRGRYGRYVDLASGHIGVFGVEHGFKLSALLGFGGQFHLLALVSPSGEAGRYTFERLEVTTTPLRRSTVTHLPDGIDPWQIDVAAALIEGPARSSTEPDDITRVVALVAALAGVVAFIAVVVIGRLWRRHIAS
jgi:hypothetical protein